MTNATPRIRNHRFCSNGTDFGCNIIVVRPVLIAADCLKSTRLWNRLCLFRLILIDLAFVGVSTGGTPRRFRSGRQERSQRRDVGDIVEIGQARNRNFDHTWT